MDFSCFFNYHDFYIQSVFRKYSIVERFRSQYFLAPIDAFVYKVPDLIKSLSRLKRLVGKRTIETILLHTI